MKTLIALALSAAMFGAQDKTYDLTLEAKPVQGRKCEVVEKELMKMVMMANGRVAGSQENVRDFAASEEVLAVDSNLKTKRRWTFSKATHKSEGKTVPYTFQGKNILVTEAKGKATAFDLEGGGDLTTEDVEGLKSFGDLNEDKKVSGKDLFAPDKPVKDGETWTKDVKKVIQAMFDKNMAKSVDAAKSKISFTLKSVEIRGGAEHGKITGVMELLFTSFGPLKLDQPIPMKLSIDVDACIDGRRPDADLRMKGGMKGRSPVTTEQGEMEIEIDFTMEGTRTVKTTN